MATVYTSTYESSTQITVTNGSTTHTETITAVNPSTFYASETSYVSGCDLTEGILYMSSNTLQTVLYMYTNSSSSSCSNNNQVVLYGNVDITYGFAVSVNLSKFGYICDSYTLTFTGQMNVNGTSTTTNYTVSISTTLPVVSSTSSTNPCDITLNTGDFTNQIYTTSYTFYFLNSSGTQTSYLTIIITNEYNDNDNTLTPVSIDLTFNSAPSTNDDYFNVFSAIGYLCMMFYGIGYQAYVDGGSTPSNNQTQTINNSIRIIQMISALSWEYFVPDYYNNNY